MSEADQTNSNDLFEEVQRTVTDKYAEKLENERRLQEWRANKKREAEERERAEKQSALEAYLRRRSEEWVATTGSTDGLNEALARWRAAYLDAREAEAEAERQAKIAAVTREHYDF
jgi:hypothetical protein